MTSKSKSGVPPTAPPPLKKNAASRQASAVSTTSSVPTRTPVAARAEVTSFSDVQPQLMKVLYDPEHHPMLDESFKKIEKSSGIKREQLVYAGCVVLALYLIFGGLAQFICNLIGFGYPAYASVKAVRTSDKDDDTQWLIYWTVFAAFSLIDCFANVIMSWMPLYYVLKVIFLLYLALPQTKGAIRLYYKYVDPAITKLDAYIAQYFEKKTA